MARVYLMDCGRYVMITATERALTHHRYMPDADDRANARRMTLTWWGNPHSDGTHNIWWGEADKIYTELPPSDSHGWSTAALRLVSAKAKNTA